jgi:hypothetical protein
VAIAFKASYPEAQLATPVAHQFRPYPVEMHGQHQNRSPERRISIA